ncbi:MAG: succinate dehydrogenase cytochrome b subunit [Chitinophagaceae bacterium]|nr:succinate dehydrogenase cytochrome b subunit [Chitinophagaceae bacterium]
MTWKQVFTSSIGRKLVMAFTGIFLILFLIVHVGINAMIFADLNLPIWPFDANENGVIFNKAAHFMGSTVLVRILEVGLFAGFILHIVQGLVLEADNRSRRGTDGYAVNLGNRGSKWYSRSMGLLGTILLIFLIIHWWHFWVPARFTGHAELPNEVIAGVEMYNMFNLMKYTFQQGWVVVVYVLACISLAYHLLHGFQSAFRTVGLVSNKWLVLVQSLGVAYSIVVPLLFALMPVAMYFGWVG